MLGFIVLLPFVMIFAQGEMLPTAVNDRFRRSFVIIARDVLRSLPLYAVFAPVYWYFLYRNFSSQTPSSID